MECVLDLFYNGQIFLAGSLKSQVLKALTFLDVEYMPLNTHMQLRQPTITKRRNSYSGVNTLAESDETGKTFIFRIKRWIILKWLDFGINL